MSSREPTSVAEAEDEAARAQERAEAARARATRLRRLAEAGASPASGEGSGDPNDTADVEDRDAVDDSATKAEPPLARSAGIVARLKRRGRKAVIVGAVTVFIAASLVLSGLMLWQHHTLVNERQRATESAAAARKGVAMLLSIDANHAKEDFQRIIDDSTGEFKTQLEVTALPVSEGMQQSKISTKATVDAVAVMSTTENSAVVLVAAKSDRTGPDNPKQPDLWRILVHLDRDGGQLKMSKVEFLP